MLALSDTAGVILLVLGGIFVVAAVGGASSCASRVTREPAPDIPPAMEPGPSDPALETPLLQKLQGWGVRPGRVLRRLAPLHVARSSPPRTSSRRRR